MSASHIVGFVTYRTIGPSGINILPQTSAGPLIMIKYDE